MLYELYAENFALMTGLRLQLAEGMNAITGETGAGKSLIVDALSLLIGGRASDGLIRSGCERSLVEGTFLPPFPRQAHTLLQELSLDTEDTLILSRELIRGGRGVARINGRTVPLTVLRELAHTLVNIHGQQEHMSLLEDSRQLFLLDAFDHCSEGLLADVAQAYAAWQAAKKMLTSYEKDREKNAARLEDLQRITEELEKAAVTVGEEESLSDESRLLSYGEKLFHSASAGMDALEHGAMDGMNDALQALRDIAPLDPEAEALFQRQRNLYFETEDMLRELTSYRDRVNLDAYRLEAVESRLAVLGKLKKKYVCAADELPVLLENARKEASDLEELSFSAEKLIAGEKTAEADYRKAAAKLSALRKNSAEKLGAAITRELTMLGMPKALFRVDLPENAPGANGTEHALFMIQPNPGEPFQPVAQIASGGELSRIILGIKVILAKLDFVPTLIFDEVDTGLSGKALNSVAQRIAVVGETAQAVVVTHNAVMAAAASNQVLIEKHQEEERTVSCAHTLDRRQRIEEIARMIAGDRVGEITRRQAEELMDTMSQPQLF